VSFPFRIRRQPSRPSRHAFGALIVIAALIASFAGLATVSPANATLDGGSPFNALNGELDGNAGLAHPDLPEGSGDDSYKGGAKEADLCPTVEDGSIQNKGELLDIYIATGEGDANTFLYLAFNRLETASQNGTVAIDFELNQATALACNGVNPVRTIGDKLITYEFHGSTEAPVILISLWTWDGNDWDGPIPLPGNAAEGSINDARTFGEMAINLEEAGIFKQGRCDNFASVFMKGRSSSAEAQSSELKDFIAPVPQHVANCGSLTVSKTVTGGKAGDKFDFTVDCPGTDNDAAFSLKAGESETVEDIPLGAECVVTETDPGSFWTVTRTINAAASGSGPATVVIDPDNESVEFTNAAKPNGIILDKKVNGADHATIGDALVARTLDDLTYTVKVTNTGQVPLTITALADSLYTGFPAAGDCPQGVGSTLAPGASFTCTYHVSMAGAANNVAKVIAVDESNREVSDDDGTFVAAPVEVLGIVLEQPAPAAVLPRTGTPARDAALLAFGLAGLGLGLRRLSRRPQHAI
jgi:uncharacterized repeat protein (TIGR01451 family)